MSQAETLQHDVMTAEPKAVNLADNNLHFANTSPLFISKSRPTGLHSSPARVLLIS